MRRLSGRPTLTLDEMHRIAATRGGRCLSTVYSNFNTPLRWECASGHTWTAIPRAVKGNGSWCKRCSDTQKGQARRLTIEDMRRLAAERGGKCLSDEYVNNSINLLWECANGHRWSARPGSLDRLRSWCPHCARYSSSYGERVSRFILEAMFRSPFLKARPSWLVGHKGARLELDGYAPSIGIAFEYHGTQHYEQTPLHTPEGFEDQKRRDQRKAELCREHGVRLIVIPAFSDHFNLKGCIEQVEFQAIWAGLTVPKRWLRPTSLRELDVPLHDALGKSGVKELRAIAAQHGGSLVTEVVSVGTRSLRWRCARSHEWTAPAYSVRSGRWCLQCRGRRIWQTRQANAAAKLSLNCNP